MGSNQLLPIVGALVLLMVVFIGLKACFRDNGVNSNNVLLEKVPQAPTPDSDSPADTIRTLTAQVASMKSQTAALDQQNKNLLKQRDEISANVSREVREDLLREQSSEFHPVLTQLTAELSGLKSRLNDIDTASLSIGHDIPVGLGFDSGSASREVETIAWIEPLGRANSLDSQAKTSAGNNPLATQTDTDELVSRANLQPKASESPKPAYTVPRNATLVGSTGMTALIGRIPIKGQIEDPFPFKVIVGRDNLAANGLEIPDVDGMIFSGTALGDWTLSCVRGEITSVTYVFEDGTIRTLSSDDNNLKQNQSSNPGKALGWLSDRRGIPCISGERISNGASYLAARIFAKGIEAGAKAFANSQTTQTVSNLTGVTTSNVTGDALKFAGYQTLAGGSEEISTYLSERMAQSFDVIYVDTGVEVAIHIDRELPIDYDPQGRKLSYAKTVDPFRRASLD